MDNMLIVVNNQLITSESKDQVWIDCVLELSGCYHTLSPIHILVGIRYILVKLMSNVDISFVIMSPRLRIYVQFY